MILLIIKYVFIEKKKKKLTKILILILFFSVKLIELYKKD